MERNLPYIMAKDMILDIIADIGIEGANYKAMQFTGNIVKEMCMEERLTLTNMSTEAGAKSGIIEPDSVTYDYINTRILQTIRQYTEMITLNI